jgi:hypothetical protein
MVSVWRRHKTMAPARACLLLCWAIRKKEAAMRVSGLRRRERDRAEIFGPIKSTAAPSLARLFFQQLEATSCRLGRMPTVALLFANTSLILIHWPAAWIHTLQPDVNMCSSRRQDEAVEEL